MYAAHHIISMSPEVQMIIITIITIIIIIIIIIFFVFFKSVFGPRECHG